MGNGATMSSSVSVCMATYNGERFVEPQIMSILSQLGDDDELIVVDDGSTDATVSIVTGLHDGRIRLHEQRNAGPVRAFEHAIGMARGSLIMLADQDDVWPPHRRRHLVSALDHSHVAAGALSTFGSLTGTVISFNSTSPNSVASFGALVAGRAPFYGCAMAFDRDVSAIALPFPSWIEAHDHWIAVCGLTLGRPRLLAEVVTLRRIHDANLSTRIRRPMRAALRTRVVMVRMALVALWRRFKFAGSAAPG
jgi:glycosyltransferase involved in cell wall biosynthesis